MWRGIWGDPGVARVTEFHWDVCRDVFPVDAGATGRTRVGERATANDRGMGHGVAGVAVWGDGRKQLKQEILTRVVAWM